VNDAADRTEYGGEGGAGVSKSDCEDDDCEYEETETTHKKLQFIRRSGLR
jgi:hypothetical protein